MKKSNKGKIWLWILGWICIFPVPLTILMLRKNGMKPGAKYGVIAAAWLVYLIIGFSPKTGTDTNNLASDSRQATSESTEVSNDEDRVVTQLTNTADTESEVVDRSVVTTNDSKVDNKTAEEEKAEQEKLAKEKAEKEKAEQEKLAKEKAEQERAEEERLAQEQAEQERLAKEQAEQERLAQEAALAAQQESSDVNRSSSSSSNSSAVDVPDGNIAGENLVWVPVNGGTKYHTRSSCSKMEDPVQIPLTEAEQRGYTPCKKCH